MNDLARCSRMAFLDLVCCGLGAGTLLFLLAVVSVPAAPVETMEGMLLVRCKHKDGPRAEVGVEFRPPGQKEWRRAVMDDGRSENYQAASFYAAASGPNAGSDALLILFAPIEGIWSFRPFLVDFPHAAADTLAATRVTLHFHGPVEPAQQSPDLRGMRRPGDFGQTVSLVIRGSGG